MTTLSTTTRALQPPREKRGTFSKSFNWTYFLQDNFTGSTALMIWVALLALVTLGVTALQLNAAPQRAGAIATLWVISVLATVIGELFTLHIAPTRWLKKNMYNSVSNTLVTLLIALLVGQVLSQIWNWGYVNATFDPALTAPDVRTTGASWGVIWAARKLLLTGPLEPVHTWRVLLFAGMYLGLWFLTLIVTRPAIKRTVPFLAKTTNLLWLLSPVAAYIFLAGISYEPPFLDLNTLVTGLVVVLVLMGLLWSFKVIQLNLLSIVLWVAAWPVAYLLWRLIGETGLFPPIDVNKWGGLLLTMIFAIFVNILSFPAGILLA
ncbi:MAG: hypothetical protein KDE19_02170, partial [Caldilineaceae bacterium]|nr:hypothetical protein [Caldilineaceae bacterium]